MASDHLTNRIEQDKKRLLDALEKSLGIVSNACKKLEMSRTTFYQWYKDDPAFALAVDSVGDIALDFAESKLLENVNNGSDTAIIFYLKCKGKNRGYRQDEDRQAQKLEVQVIMPEVPESPQAPEKSE